MTTIADLFMQYGRAGVYAASPTQLDLASQSATAINFDCWQVVLSATETAPALLRHIGQDLRFPQWYGENWDALADCLTDLSWSDADGFVLMLRGSAVLNAAQPMLWQTLIDMLGEVSSFWCENHVGFWILADDTDVGLPQLPNGKAN